MEHRLLGRSGIKVPVLSFGAATFGGKGEFFEKWGATDAAEATRMVDLCLDNGVNFFDTADVYSTGVSEEILGAALKGRMDKAIISTKGGFSMGDGRNDRGSSRYHISRACEASLKRLGTDHIDLYFLHGFDGLTAMDEIMYGLDMLVRSGKVGSIGVSNYSGWQLMKAIAISDRYGLARHVAYQGCYSLISRDYEWELMPLALDQGVGTMVWSPLGWGRLTGKIDRDNPPKSGRIAEGGEGGGPPVDDEHLFNVVDVLKQVAEDTGKTVAQVSLNWLLQRPTVCNVIIGARNEEQLKQNLGAIGWNLTVEQVARLDAVSRRHPVYPYWHQIGTAERNPKPTEWGLTETGR